MREYLKTITTTTTDIRHYLIFCIPKHVSLTITKHLETTEVQSGKMRYFCFSEKTHYAFSYLKITEKSILECLLGITVPTG